MNKNRLEEIIKYLKNYENDPKITQEEKEVALNILQNLKGTTVIRATKILNFCLAAIEFSKID